MESRHLGLKTAGEITDIQGKDRSAGRPSGDGLGEAGGGDGKAVPRGRTPFSLGEQFPLLSASPWRGTELSAFTYAETLDALREAGAEPVFFSPVRDTALPEGVCGLYLPGGYPELYAQALSENKTMRASIRQAVNAGLPTAAECGGFLYLGQSLEDTEGKSWPMAGVLPGAGVRAGRLVRFGYAILTAKRDSMLFRAGEGLPVHEFHHWDSTANGTAFTARKNEKMQWECGFANENFYAGFPHLYWRVRPCRDALCVRQNDTAKQKG